MLFCVPQKDKQYVFITMYSVPGVAHKFQISFYYVDNKYYDHEQNSNIIKIPNDIFWMMFAYATKQMLYILWTQDSSMPRWQLCTLLFIV